MNKIKAIVSLVLVFAMMLSMSSFALFDEIDDVCVFLSTPTLDGVMEKADGWSDPVVLDNETLVTVSHSKQNPIDMKANAYMAYDMDNLYFAAEVTEYDVEGILTIDNLLCPSSDVTEAIDGGDYGFDGDVFGITLDAMSLLTADSSKHESKAPFYCVGFDADGNAALYRSNGKADEIVSSDYSDVKVTLTDTGWVFEAAISHEIILEDMCAVNGIESLDWDTEFAYLFGNVDGKANFVYKSNRFDHEAEEVITYAEYASVAETALDGMPGTMVFGTPVKTFGITYYLNHEHEGKLLAIESEDDFATFDKEGTRYYICDVCGVYYGKHTVPMIPFTDVKAGQWYENALVHCYNWELFNGMSETKFGPNIAMTRAMFVQVLANWYGVDTSEYTCDQFTDVKPSHWYYGAVAWAYENGITSGTSADKFSPNKALTRQEAAALFMNVMKNDGIYTAPEGDFDEKFTDVNKIASWAKEAMLWAVDSGIINGTTPTTLAPTGKATRMQVAQMFCEFEYFYLSQLMPEVEA